MRSTTFRSAESTFGTSIEKFISEDTRLLNFLKEHCRYHPPLRWLVVFQSIRTLSITYFTHHTKHMNSSNRFTAHDVKRLIEFDLQFTLSPPGRFLGLTAHDSKEPARNPDDAIHLSFFVIYFQCVVSTRVSRCSSIHPRRSLWRHEEFGCLWYWSIPKLQAGDRGIDPGLVPSNARDM